ncbi:SIMPL domain-containing protein [Psychrobacter aestuarii]|uniref:SIMPL domain-containing protein n=1 Tax=Psychrobacter aestuarii TaxID=556327 RepID=A0ABN0VPC0_9GAMM|nr:SIMPL domain-containing protein [Psychrobacter aestuarii]
MNALTTLQTAVRKPLLTVSGAALLAAMTMGSAQAETTGYNQISFQSEVKSEVANDEIRASLYKQAQATNAKSLATTLTNSINKAMMIAKRYPTVTVTTGQQQTYPRYDKNNKITGWTGQANVELKSSDFEATSQLIAELQSDMMMNNLSFGVSDSKKAEVEKKLMVEASKDFQNQAREMTTAWGARGYRIVSVNLNKGTNYPVPMYRSMAKAEMMDASVPSQNFESGNSTVSVTANGTIELSK